MSRPEKSGRKRLGRIERELLEQLTLGDLAYSILLSGRSSRRMFKLARERAMDRYRRKKALERLISQKCILERAEKLGITEKGENALEKTVASTAKLLGSRWDGKWRVVIFDIPERYAVLRNRIRTILKRAGFVQLQLSVWVFPHECGELTQLIKEESRLSKYILYGVFERVENGELLKKRFRL